MVDVIKAPSPPPMTPEQQEKVREIVYAMSGYHIGPPPIEALQDESKRIHYCMAAQGVMEIRTNLIGRGVSPARRIGGLPDMPCGFEMTLPKIPWEMFAKTVMFFREVIRRNNRSLEAIVQFFFDPTMQQYEMYIPEQKVGGASVHHTAGGDPDNTKIHVGDIHSHGSGMSAFFSGTDDGDESKAERLYGVIGNVNDPMPSMKFRARIGSAFVELGLGEMVVIPDDTQVIKLSAAAMKQMLQSKTAQVDIFSGYDVPEEWFDKVKTEVHQPNQNWRGDFRVYQPKDDYFRAKHHQVGFAPAWKRHHQANLPSTADRGMLVSSSGKVYVDTDKGIFEIQSGGR